jgi:hypothetical protein
LDQEDLRIVKRHSKAMLEFTQFLVNYFVATFNHPGDFKEVGITKIQTSSTMWVNRELFKRQWKYIFGILWSADTQ